MSVSTGMTIGKYELGKELGRGGFGSVFVARDVSLDREVALKFMHAEHTASAEIVRRFLQEARSAAKVVHAGIVTVFECGQLADGVAYIAMELLHGETLTSRLSRRGRLAPAAAVEIARQIASALEAAHHAGIVHRDLKPDNIFLVSDAAMPSGERVKVLDFGIAKLAQPETTASSVHTHSMMVFGTPRYMSPEQCRSSANIDHRSDIYSLGCILFELVVGRAPFDGEVGELIAKHQMVAPPTARSERPELPAALDDLIAKMLAKDPAQRPQTMMAVQRALAGEPEVSGIEPTLPPTLGDLARYTPVPKSILGPAPVAASSTTLGTASGQRDGSAVAPRSKKLVIGGVAGAAIAGIALWFGLARSGQDTRPAAPPVGATIAQPPPPPPQPIVIELTSTPAAEIYSADRRLLGTTPFTYRRAPADGQLVFFVTADGYVEQRVEIPADRSDTRAVTLDAIPKPVATVPAAVVAKPKPARPTNATKKPLKPGELPDEQ